MLPSQHLATTLFSRLLQPFDFISEHLLEQAEAGCPMKLPLASIVRRPVFRLLDQCRRVQNQSSNLVGLPKIVDGPHEDIAGFFKGIACLLKRATDSVNSPLPIFAIVRIQGFNQLMKRIRVIFPAWLLVAMDRGNLFLLGPIFPPRLLVGGGKEQLAIFQAADFFQLVQRRPHRFFTDPQQCSKMFAARGNIPHVRAEKQAKDSNLLEGERAMDRR